MSLRTAPLLLLLTLSASAMAQESVITEGSRPLNLSLPRDVHWSSPVRPDLAAPERSRSDSVSLPDPGAGATSGQRGRMPYGTGYESRQRNNSGGESGSAAGRSHDQGGGKGMGRSR